MDPGMHDDGLRARTALLVQRLRSLLIALRDSAFELQEVVTTIETTAAEHRCALCGAPISSASAPSTTSASPSTRNPS
jgi:hypothetical protein